jgi:hypothetical protein
MRNCLEEEHLEYMTSHFQIEPEDEHGVLVVFLVLSYVVIIAHKKGVPDLKCP